VLEGFRSRVSRAVILRLLASVGLALILWSFVTVDQDPETTRTFPNTDVTVANLRDSLQVVNELDDVTVRLSGPSSVINPIDAGAISAEIDLGEISEPGEYRAEVVVRAPEGVWRTSVEPPSIPVTIDDTRTEELPLTVAVSDMSGNGGLAVDVAPEIETVQVHGPNVLVDRIAQVVLTVDVVAGTRVYEDTLVPEARDANGNRVDGISINPSAVRATISVSTRGKSVAVLVQVTGSPAPGYEVVDRTVNPPTILIDGPAEIIDGLVAVRTEPIDVSGAQDSLTQRTSLADIPEGVTVLEPASSEVDVLVQIGQRGISQSLPGQRVGVTNLEANLTATVDPSEVTIQVVAPADVLEALSNSNIRVQVDVGGLGPGTYQLAPTVAVPPRVQWISALPSTVQVIISEVEAVASPPNGTPSPVNRADVDNT
jgi:YbbR domain-containing protein